MNASKENARKAHAWIRDIMKRCKYPAQVAAIVEEGQQFIEDFLLRAEAKLPTEEAFARDKPAARRARIKRAALSRTR